MGQKTHDHPYLVKTKVPKPSLYRLPNTQDITFRKRPTGNQSLQKMYQLPPEFHRFKQITRNMNSWALLSRTSRKIAMGDIWNQECQILVKNFGILISSRAGTGASTVQPNGKTTSYLIPLRDRKESRRWRWGWTSRVCLWWQCCSLFKSGSWVVVLDLLNKASLFGRSMLIRRLSSSWLVAIEWGGNGQTGRENNWFI